jgi:uncharacterized protein
LINQIKADMKQAMRNKDKVTLSTLRMLLATIDNERIKLKRDLTDDDVITCINRNLKQLMQEIDSLADANRSIDNQLEQRAILVDYLPKQLTEEEVRALVREAVIEVKLEGGNFGQVMKQLSDLKGKADMKFVSSLAREKFHKIEVD